MYSVYVNIDFLYAETTNAKSFVKCYSAPAYLTLFCHPQGARS